MRVITGDNIINNFSGHLLDDCERILAIIHCLIDLCNTEGSYVFLIMVDFCI